MRCQHTRCRASARATRREQAGRGGAPSQSESSSESALHATGRPSESCGESRGSASRAACRLRACRGILVTVILVTDILLTVRISECSD
jgi:hypothetical protein